MNSALETLSSAHERSPRGVGSEVKFPSTKGGSVNKENPQKTFTVIVVVVWISITVLHVKIINPKNDHSHVKTN